MKIDRWDQFIRWFITLIILGFYIGSVFFGLNGNYKFLFTFEYYFTTISSTSIAFFLRYIWSDKGVDTALFNNPDIADKEEAKGAQIALVSSNDNVDLLKIEIDRTNLVEKKKEYTAYVDKKIMTHTQKGWYKLFRKGKLEKWKERKLVILKDEFNWDIVRIKYYRYDIDEMLSTFYKENPNERRFRRSKNQKVVGSLKTNLATIIIVAVFKMVEVTITDFKKESIFILLGQLFVFMMNINNGYKLGKGYINEDYSQNLSEDYVFLKTFNKKFKKEVIA